MAPIRCWRCGDEQPPAFFCRSCGVVQKLLEDVDLFAVLGLPSHPAVDPAELEARYYELSRRLHPDRYQTGPADELQASVRATAILNRTLRTLREPEARGRYWLERFGEKLGHQGGDVPAALAAYVFEVQEKLEDARAARDGARAVALGELTEAKRELDERRALGRAHLDDLLREWPRGADAGSSAGDTDVKARVTELKNLLAELSYLRTLERDVRAAVMDLDAASPSDGAARAAES